MSLQTSKGRQYKRKIVFIWFFGVLPPTRNALGGFCFMAARMPEHYTHDVLQSAEKMPKRQVVYALSSSATQRSMLRL